MNFKHQKREVQAFSILSPWDTQPDENYISKYCSDLIQPVPLLKKHTNLPKINTKRAASTCAALKKQENHHFPERTAYSRRNLEVLNELSQRHFETLSQHRSERTEKKKGERENVLQELSVKNFIIEGGQDPSNYYKEKNLKKRESSYVLKHKFAEFRRSLKMVGANKENANFKVIRYEI